MLQLGQGLASLLHSMFVVLLALREKKVASDVRQELNDEWIVDEVKQLGLDLGGEDHVHFSDVADFPLVSDCHLVLFRPNVHLVPQNGPVRL